MQQEMMWWQWRDASAGPVNRLHLTADRQPRQSPPPYHSIFYWPDALPDAQPTVSKHCYEHICDTVARQQEGHLVCIKSAPVISGSYVLNAVDEPCLE